MSKHGVPAGDIGALLVRFSDLRQKALARTGKSFSLTVIQEAGLDGFWIHRVLEKEGIESHVVDAASVATSRRCRRAKTDRIDGEALVRTLLAYKRGEPHVCAMVKAPTPEEEDRRRLCRERKVLTSERVLHINRIKGLLFSQGVYGYEPLRRDRRQRLDELRTGDGRPLPPHLKAQISRELDRVELLLKQIKTVEDERDALLADQQVAMPAPTTMLLSIKGIGSEIAAILWSEGLFRHFDNRRQVASYAGLAPDPSDVCLAREGDRVPEQWSGMLSAHNERRAEHCVAPLIWSNELAAAAQAYADQCILNVHGSTGENMADAWTEMDKTPVLPALSDKDAFGKAWYCEVNNFSNPQFKGGFTTNCKDVNGHFTQVVWKNTCELGCGRATCDIKDDQGVVHKGTHWVCRYKPPGNVNVKDVDELKKQVLPPKCK